MFLGVIIYISQIKVAFEIAKTVFVENLSRQETINQLHSLYGINVNSIKNNGRSLYQNGFWS